MKSCLFFFLVALNSLSALSFFDLNEAIPQTVLDKEQIYSPLEGLNGQEITIKGFVYRQGEDWILSSEPNLKSCCIGSSQNLLKQIYLTHYENKPAHRHLVTLQGNFRINPQWNGEKLERFYFLTDIKPLSSPNRTFLYVILSSGILISLIMLFILIKRARRELEAEAN